MSQLGDRIENATIALSEIVVVRRRAVIVAFLLVTAVFAGGMTMVTTESDATDSFTQDVPAQNALDAVEEEFEAPFAPDDESTQLVQTGTNVLSRTDLLANLRVLERVDEREELRMASANGPATLVAQQLDPSATTPTEQQRAIRTATDTELRAAIRAANEGPRFDSLVSDDFNPNEASASASVTVITHDVPQGFSDGDLQTVQTTIETMAADEPADIRAFGSGIINAETGQIIGDSLALVMPIVAVLLLGFLIIAYRDPIDLALGLSALVMTLIWTFGFLGFSGIPFTQQQISTPVLLLAVGVDFGIHIINRYREETVTGLEAVPSMRIATRQLMIAFVIVTATAVFGFGANALSDLPPIRNLGIISAVGIVFTFLIFGLFLPAAKLEVDRLRERFGVPEFNSEPIASEESSLGRLLSVFATAGDRAPILLVIVILLFGGGMAAYGTGVDTSFSQEDFLPPEEEPAYVQYVPEPFAPGEYTVSSTLDILEDRFATNQDESITIYVEGPMERDDALEGLVRPNDDPPETLALGDENRVRAESIVTVIRDRADRDPAFAALVARNDRDGDGIPDRNLDRVYSALLSSPSGDRAERYLTEDRRSTQVVYSVEPDAEQGVVTAQSQEFATEFRYTATATGSIVVFDAISGIIFDSAIQGLLLSLLLTAVFLMIVYGVLESKPLLGIVNVFPILVSVASLVGTMRLLGLALNALTATLLSIGVGLGIAYSVHITARFVDEYDRRGDALDAIRTTLTGTGGALLGSMLTTSLGTGALALAITPVLGNFGLLMGLSVAYSFIISVVALPPALILWDRASGAEARAMAALRS
ncbi:RND family transporter [Halorubrum rutilum]|uniref:RND family transporter n=1 Tax=Halorubrum rutilum TaxID=1364933 RepID=A0ABD6AP27_9EURY|nr:MMPL family transporter [Halorubrum rutilum]